MNEKTYNYACVTEIDEHFENFKTEGETAHDLLLIIHTVNTPKGNEDAEIRILLKGCPCNLEPAVERMMDLSLEMAQAFIKAVTNYSLNKLQQDKPQNKTSEI